MTSDISENIMKDYYDTNHTDSFGSDEASVIIVNPTKYMIDPIEL